MYFISLGQGLLLAKLLRTASLFVDLPKNVLAIKETCYTH